MSRDREALASNGARRRLALAALWLGVLLLAGMLIAPRLDIGGDLRHFMPAAQTPAQRLLLDELGEGPGSRLLLLALSAADPATLARQSQGLRQALAQDPVHFETVANGAAAEAEAFSESMRHFRYLLSPAADGSRFDPAHLADALAERVQDLGSPAASLIEPLLPSDPTLETLRLAEHWQPANAPGQRHGVWFDRAGREALLVVQTRAGGFDPTGQEAAVAALRAAYDRVRGAAPGRLEISGPGAFSVEVGGRTRREASLIGTLDSAVFVLLLWLAYRSWKAPLLGGLPLASAGLAGLSAVALAFDGVHGITVAFGFTLIGVAQDYPIHLFSHQRPGLSPWASARALWPTLGTGVASTCIAYLTFLISGVDGLRQLAVFTIVGLGTAALATRFLLPGLIDPAPRDVARSPRLAALWARIGRWPRVPAVVWGALAVAAIALALGRPGPFWQNDLSRLTPVPPPLLARDAQLRRELGAPDVRYVITVPGRDAEAALAASERLAPRLERLRGAGALAGFDHAARYLPSAATQRERQSKLPEPAALRRALDAAIVPTPFRADAFEPFVEDVERARTARPLLPRDLVGTPLAARIAGLLLERKDGAVALISLTGLADPAAVAEAARAQGAQLLDLKQASESLVAEYRQRVLWALALAAVLLVLTVWAALRQPRRVLRVLAPMALTTVLILAVLRGAGVELTLFHLVALILAAGLGLDYALFFDHAGDRRDDQLRALHAILVCSATTLLVFSALAASSIPVLRAIGTTVAVGVLGNFVLALLIVRAPAAATAGSVAPSSHPS